MSKPQQGAAVFGHEFNFDQRAARRQIAAAFPSPGERDAARRCDFRISPVSKVPGAYLDAKNSAGAWIERVLLASNPPVTVVSCLMSWPRLTWPAWEAPHAGPRWRKMSATSTAGRDNGRASAEHL